MARKLFSMENDNTDAIAEPEVGEEEVGEVADVATDTVDEGVDIGEGADAIDSGVDAVEQGEQIEELVETAGEDGLTPVAAEAVRIAIEAVCSKVGYNSKKFYSLYATENFSSPSSSKANTAIALEGVGEFLKEMWAKIKASLTALWTKVKAFWAKHVSTLGRVKKALDSMKSKVSASTGKLEGPAFKEEAPSGLASAFAGKNDISKAVVEKYINAHSTALSSLTSISATVEDLNKIKFGDAATSSAITSAMGKVTSSALSIGTKDAPLIGGSYAVVKFGKVDIKDDDGGFEFEVQKEQIDDKETKLGISIASKEDLKKILTSTQEVIKNTVKYKEKSDKLGTAIAKYLGEVSSAIEKPVAVGSNNNTIPRDAELTKDLRKTMKFYYRVNSKIPSIANDVFTHNVRLAKAVLGYSAFCLRSYK